MSRAAWFRTRRRDDERFARAVESGSDSDSFGAELAVVAALRRLGDSVTVDDRARERIVRRIVASPPRPRPRARLRPAALLAGLFSLVVALTGLGTALAQNALPGEPLYHLKLVQETVTLGLTFDAEDDAVRRLSYASRRLDEMTELGRHEGPDDSDEDGYQLALREFTAHATEGTSRLTALATRSDTRLLSVLSSWARRESTRLDTLIPALPATVGDDLGTLLQRIERRATALSARMDCYEITSATTDDLGALPATIGCAAPSPLPQHTDKPHTRPSIPAKRKEHTPPRDVPAPEHRRASMAIPYDTPEQSRRPVQPEGSLDPTDVAPPPTVPAPVPAPTRARLPDSSPEEPPLLSIATLLPGLPAVTIG